MEVTMSNSVQFDITRGVDVMRADKVVQHFDGPLALERAKLAAADPHLRGGYIRYWGVKEGK